MRYLRPLLARDPGFLALRRAGRTAIVMPAMFALAAKVLRDPDMATFAAFGSFAMLLMVDFGGPVRDRVQAQVALAAVGGVFVCIGTLASRQSWLAAGAMVVVGFAVLFAGVISSALAGATTSLLLAFILPVCLSAPPSTIPSRLAGWGLAAVAALLVTAFLWPAPARDPLRRRAAGACRELSARLRSGVADHPTGAVAALNQTFLATPYRPTGLTTATRTVVRLVDQLTWLDVIIGRCADAPPGVPVNPAAAAVRSAAADALERAAELLDATDGAVATSSVLAELEADVARLEAARDRMEVLATRELPVARTTTSPRSAADDGRIVEFVSSLDPSFRAQELAYAVSLIARTVVWTVAADRRSWLDRLLGRQPEGVPGAFATARERALAHLEVHSVWLHNSVRGAVGLGLAVLTADMSGVQHSFWVVLGTLSVLRTNALSTGQNALRGLLGTVVGFVVGALLVIPLGPESPTLWLLLPPAILIAGVAPSVISFAAGQAAFTVVIVILFNIIAPSGWRVGLLRLEDVALGAAVSLVVGFLFWPRGAASALGRALAEAYADSARYLARSVEFGMIRCDVTAESLAPPTVEAARAAAAARRLDDTFRTYLAERGAKPVRLPEISSLVTGVAGLRLAADAVQALWQQEDGRSPGDRAHARAELLAVSATVRDWYDDLAVGLAYRRPVPDALPHDKWADGRLLEAVRADLRSDDGRVGATAVRLIWTSDHLDAARRLQASLVQPARAFTAAP